MGRILAAEHSLGVSWFSNELCAPSEGGRRASQKNEINVSLVVSGSYIFLVFIKASGD